MHHPLFDQAISFINVAAETLIALRRNSHTLVRRSGSPSLRSTRWRSLPRCARCYIYSRTWFGTKSDWLWDASHTRIAVSPVYHAALASATRGILYSTRGLQKVQGKIKLVTDCAAPRDAPPAKARTTLFSGQRCGKSYIDRAMNHSWSCSTPDRCDATFPNTTGAIFRGAGTTSPATGLVSVSDDSSRAWNSVRRVPGSVCGICAATVRRASRREDYSKARSSNDVTTNRSSIVRTVGGRLCRTALLSSKSVCKTLRNAPIRIARRRRLRP